jgi:hypothetical protein
MGLREAEVDRLNHAGLGRALAWLERERPSDRPSVLLLSPHRHNVRFLARRLPHARLTILTRRQWDLNRPAPSELGCFDWAIASNVFHYAREPQAWVDHVLARAGVLVIQDLIDRRRAEAPPHLAADGDAMRYGHSLEGVWSSHAGAFDLAGLNPRPAYFEAFEGAPNALHGAGDPPRHFAAVVVSPDPPVGPVRPSTWRERWRLACYRHLPLYLPYKAVLAVAARRAAGR